ncbi:MAG: PhnD/SsuA/transferrin family substrate-binding protein [Cyanobacteria bacterium P01_G01_bin.54]
MFRHRLWATALLLLTACSNVSNPAPSESTSAGAEGGGAIAACPDTLSFAVTDIPGEERLKDEFGPFQDQLSELLGRAIELFPVSNHVAATPALMFDQVDLALAGPSEYVLMNAQADAVPVVGITRPGYYTVLLVKAGSDITSIDEMKGKILGIREEGSTAGHLGVLRILTEAGIDPKADVELKVIGDDSGLTELLDGKIDIWADASTRYQRVLGEEGLDEAEFAIPVQGEQLPNDIIVANPSLDPDCLVAVQTRVVENEQIIMEAILASPANQKYAESEMVAAKDEDYEIIREGYKIIGEESYLK